MATATLPRETTRPIEAQPVHDRLYRMSLETYHRIAESGILGPKDRVVLLDGVLVTKMTRGNPHITSVRLIHEALRGIIPPGWMVAKEDPIALPGGPTGHDSEPEPDIAVIRGAVRDFAARKPLPADIGLIVEVAESSLRHDRAGLARYAWAGIPTVWIVNLVSRAVEVYTDPSGPVPDPTYRHHCTIDVEEEAPVVLDGQEIGRVRVREILP